MICECHSLEHQVVFWYDEGRLEYLSTSITEDDVKADDNGCDKQAPKK
jgi:hypothetical protein